MKAVVSNIERLATYDGPGLRTVIYFKGCPLRCVWCSNPETQLMKKQVMVNHSKCIECKNCQTTCPAGAISFNQKVMINFNLCNLCNACVDVCPTGALEVNGDDYSLLELRTLINKDKIYYEKSNGGLTVSGGEMLMHGEFVVNLFKQVHADGINTAFETSGYGNHNVFKAIVANTDYLIFDYKLPTSLMIKYTQKSNELICRNLRYALKQKNVLVRIPLIPKINTDINIIEQMIKELVALGVKEVELLKYHRLGINKYRALNMPYALEENLVLMDYEYENIKQIFKSKIKTVK